MLKNIRDPEHPYTLEQLDILHEEDIEIIGNSNIFRKNLIFFWELLEKDGLKCLTVYWKPATPTYSLATHIGLAIYIQLEKTFEGFKEYKLNVLIKEGSHKNKSAGKFFQIESA